MFDLVILFISSSIYIYNSTLPFTLSMKVSDLHLKTFEEWNKRADTHMHNMNVQTNGPGPVISDEYQLLLCMTGE